MDLVEFAEYYFQNHEFGIKDNSKNCFYLPAARQFQIATKCADVSKINRDLANQFVDWLKVRPISPTTMHTRRRRFSTLWRAAYDCGMCPVFGPFRRIKVPKKSPKAWSIDCIRFLLSEVSKDDSPWTNGIDSATYWGSLISAAWDTGMRLGDLLSLKINDIEVDHKSGFGSLHHICSKVQKEQISVINPGTMKLILKCSRMGRETEFIWPLRLDRRQFYRDAKSRFKAAGLNGTFRFIRRSAVTHAESLCAGMGQRLAGHSDGRVTRESYIDPTLLPNHVVQMPSLS